ncbi:zinc-ribbon domain-containing protein [Pseudorhodobacter ferrugineus]|uniref:zinc-ribbon domain-containing protein n=1 Tax=Pseudorhodobacter ferrugineus TaxID=77008 RepID=UPI0003F680BE|nr:zinc-ribbon domain-containing protein [Pseudorhodobacter ferrugineus]
MRLVCPNCEAQYEVDDGAIADAGRDVQCSNCGHTWFQLPPDLEAERDAEDALFGAAKRPQASQPNTPPAAVSQQGQVVGNDASKAGVWDDDAKEGNNDIGPVPAPIRRPEGIGTPKAAMPAAATPPSAMPSPPPMPAPPPLPSRPQTEDAKADAVKPDAVKPEPSASAMTPPPLAPRRSLDESLMAVLREEAERETAVRRSETPRSLESQPDLGLEETTGAASAAKAVRDRLARLRGPEPEPETPEKPTARRDLLPDIEEINSTLRASTENRSGDELAMAQPESDNPASSSGFRSGFSLMLLIAVVLIATYLAAPKIAEQFPPTKAALESYVSMVDAARIWLDSVMRNAISGLQNLTGGAQS